MINRDSARVRLIGTERWKEMDAILDTAANEAIDKGLGIFEVTIDKKDVELAKFVLYEHQYSSFDVIKHVLNVFTIKVEII